MNIQTCRDTSDAVALYLPQRLYLKPFAKLHISIQLPAQKVHGKAISNWELMERLRSMIQPETFSVLKVSKNSLDVIRFEGEIESKSKLSKVLSRLDDRTIKLNGYTELLKVRASEAKLEFPSRHTWDSFFRDSTTMDEMKSGERPDTIHIANLPIEWFINQRNRHDENIKPSEAIFRKVFERFGKIRYVDVPICDPFRKEMKAHMTGISTFTYDAELYFEGYVQFSEYVGFVRAMDALRGMKLLCKHEDRPFEAVSIKVDFDKTKHLSDASIRRRSIVRERLITRHRAKEEKDKEEKDIVSKREELERRKVETEEREKLEKMREREERRKTKQLAKLKVKESHEISNKIIEEEKKLMKTQRKLQSIRLIEELFKRIQLKPMLSSNNYNYKERYRSERRRDGCESGEAMIRDKLVKRYKTAQETELENQRDRLQKALDGKLVLRSALNTRKPRPRTSSISSASSQCSAAPDLPHKKIKSEKLTTPEREHVFRTGAGTNAGYPVPPIAPYTYPYPPYPNHPPFSYHPNPGVYYARAYYAESAPYAPRGRGYSGRRPRARAAYRGATRFPFFDGPNAHQEYYKYFKRLTEEGQGHNDHDVRNRSHSRSRSRRRSYSYSRSRSRSRHRSRYTRSRSRHRRTRSPYTRSRSRSHTRRSRSSSRSRHSRSRSRSSRRNHRSRTRSKSHSRDRRTPPLRKSGDAHDKDESKAADNDSSKRRASTEKRESVDSSKFISPSRMRAKSKSWSVPKDSTEGHKSWSGSPP